MVNECVIKINRCLPRESGDPFLLWHSASTRIDPRLRGEDKLCGGRQILYIVLLMRQEAMTTLSITYGESSRPQILNSLRRLHLSLIVQNHK